MVETGKVISADSGKNQVTVQFDRKSACGKCGMCMMSEDKMKVELTLDNYLNAKIDDIVDVSMGGGYVLTSALIVYLIPLILVGISLFATKSLSEGIQIIGIIISLLFGILIAYISDKKLRNRKGYVPEIINIHQSKEETKNGRQ